MTQQDHYSICMSFKDGPQIPVSIVTQPQAFYVSCMSLEFKQLFGGYIVKLPFEAVDHMPVTDKMANQFPGNLYRRLANIRKEQLC